MIQSVAVAKWVEMINNEETIVLIAYGPQSKKTQEAYKIKKSGGSQGI